MISIVVCSRSVEVCDRLTANISDTIGVNHEIVRVDNSRSNLGICKAYNIGASRAKYEYLCFVHEDVQFLTQQWGKNLLHHFRSNEKLGLVGIAGGVYKKRMVGDWAEFENQELDIRRMNIVQHYKFNPRPHQTLSVNPLDEILSRVVTLDGVLMCTRKSIWESYRFDENLLKGFHGYDVDFALQIGERYQIGVAHDILLEHFSEGMCDLTWYDDMISVHKKWRKELPVSIEIGLAQNIDLYSSDWNKLRYILNLYLEASSSYYKVISVFHSLFLLVNYNNRRHAMIKDYLTEFLKISLKFFK